MPEAMTVVVAGKALPPRVQERQPCGKQVAVLLPISCNSSRIRPSLSRARKRGPAGRAGCGRHAGAAVKTVFTLRGNARPNHLEERAMLMLVTGIVIGFLVSTAVFAGMARIETY